MRLGTRARFPGDLDAERFFDGVPERRPRDTGGATPVVPASSASGGPHDVARYLEKSAWT